MDRPYGVRAEDGLTWYPERGLGYFPVRLGSTPYDEAYFAKYRSYDQSELGRQLTAARLALVMRHLPEGTLIDVGIGGGAFLEARRPLAPTYGYDVNPAGVAWLHREGLFRDPVAQPIDGLSFWDSLEHLPDPALILKGARWNFVSLPVFTGPDHVLGSKHFRRDEHVWYFTRQGLIGWYGAHGYRCLEHNTMESLLGREDIHTFVFARDPPAKTDPAAR